MRKAFPVEVDRGQASADASLWGYKYSYGYQQGGEDILELVTRFGAVCLSTLLSLQRRVNLFDTSEQGTPNRRTAYNIQIQQRVTKSGI